jgi:multiple sugar transport system ATP-binding protein
MAVALKHISKRYTASGPAILDDVSLDIHDGEFLVLLGPSGCGKSTLLRIIAGLETQSSGEVWIDNTCVNTISPKDRDVAMVFQNYALYPHMNVFENMAFGLKMRKLPKATIEARVHDAAESLALTDYLKRKPKELSGGQRQRVALGRAIVRQPKAFLMDEPLSNLDARLRSQTRLELEKLHQRLKTTTVYVTHDQVEAMTLGERVVVLHKGKIQQIGRPDDVYQRPANLFVGQFMGNMAFIPATLENNKSLALQTGETWALPQSLQERLTPDTLQSSRRVLIGIRPEHFSPHCAETQNADQTVSMTPHVVESLGKEKLVYSELANTPIVAEVPADFEISPSQPLSLSLCLDRIALFDATSETTILT